MGKKEKIRLDKLIADKGLSESRETAKKLILAGLVRINDTVYDKPGANVDADSNIQITRPEIQYVSRGGLKLEGAIKTFGINVSGKIAVDIGASTGGFTDFLLQNGVKKIYAIDVGYGQMHWKLRNDSRITLLERFNARFLRAEDLPEKVDIIVMDVSFISVIKIWQAAKSILKPDGIFLNLIKPQFEAGRENIPKGGVIKSTEIHKEVLSSVINQTDAENWGIVGLTSSPIAGADGNREYWLALVFKDNPDYLGKIIKPEELNLDETVKNAFKIN